jgi:tetratricopeptide (TPR) repeat protein
MLGTSRVVATALTAALLVGQAAAQPQPTPQQKQLVQDLVKQAIAKSQAGDHAGAIELYEKAYATAPLPTLLSNIGAEYQLATKPVEALKYFCMYLEKDPAGPLATYATGQAKLLKSQLTGEPVEDGNVCAAPAQQPPPPPPPTDQPLPAGPTAADPGKGLKLGGLIVGGIGVASLGLGIYFGIQAQKHTDYISDNMDQWRPDILDYQDEGQRDEYLQITFLAVGGVAVAVGTYMYLKGRSKSRSVSESTVIQPTASPGGAGVLVRGSF